MLKSQDLRTRAALLDQEVAQTELALSPEVRQELAQLYEGVAQKFALGKMVTGRVLVKDGHGVLVSIDYKSDGLIPNYEFTDHELKKLNASDEIDVILDRLEDENGAVVLSYQKAKALKAWERIAKLAADDEPVRGMVTHKVKGGLSVDVGIPAFLPGSQVDTQRVNDFDQFVGQEVTCKILKINKKRGNIIVSRRKYLEEQRFEDRKKALETISEGQVLQGVVKNITNYGAFVDIGGIDGLLHITDMSWGRISHPSELVRLGDSVTVKVISFDKKNEKISLGMKQLTPNPWEHVDQKYAIGTKVKGRISSVADYGLFIEVEKGVEGLVHISEISWTERIANLSRHFNVGDQVEALVVAVDKENRRMSLSVKQLKEDPWKMLTSKFKVGDQISGRVNNITDFGLFVQLVEGVDGLVHISDISWTDHVSHPGDRYKKGDTVQAVILGIDADNRKVSLGIKQLEQNPWDTVASQYKVGETVQGTVSKITNFGAFVKLPTGIEGLVHISEISDNEVAKVEDVLKIGQELSLRVIKVSPEERKLGLSLRPAREGGAKEQSQQANGEQQQQRSEQQQTERPARAPRPQHKQASGQQQERQRDQQQSPRQQSEYSNKPKEGTGMKSILQQVLEEHVAKMREQQEAADKEKKD